MLYLVPIDPSHELMFDKKRVMFYILRLYMNLCICSVNVNANYGCKALLYMLIL